MKSIKVLAVLAFLTVGTISNCFAQGCFASESKNLTFYMSALALFFAFVALIISIIASRRSRLKMVNTAEDFRLMLESTKNTIDKNVKNLRREMQRNFQNVPKNDSANGAEKTERPKPAPRHRRPYRRPQPKDQAQEQASAEPQDEPKAE